VPPFNLDSDDVSGAAICLNPVAFSFFLRSDD
jgi:hypothetical protein